MNVLPIPTSGELGLGRVSRGRGSFGPLLEPAQAQEINYKFLREKTNQLQTPGKMAVRTRPLSLSPKFLLPKSLTKPQCHPTPSLTFLINKTNFKISCTSNKDYNNNKNKKKKDMSDAELAAGLAVEMTKLNTQLLQKEEAMKKSKQLLFKEFCKHLGLATNEVKQRWAQMDEHEKLVLAKGFVSDWGEAFHPLSSKSVREMVNEILVDENPNSVSSNSSSSSVINLDSLKKMIGFS